MTASVSLYIHIPFCRKRCSYCSFVSYAGRLGDIAKYMQAVKYEISQRIDGRQLKSVYFGGGTPSLAPVRYIKSLMESISRYFPKSGKTEVSLEANPCTIDNTCLKDLLNAGINRLSIGLQSLDDGELSTLGRLHNSQQALEAVKHARSAGFDNINLDLIYGIPGQTVSSWEQTLREAVNLSPEHLSLYGLSLEPG
ncbi:MAG: coproporphyrinogen-III oxidase family protein, partial [Dehalococcoidales bacterium]|nr:coproporphyrinogen-III oxidase family protein [Dehalococcoidales bacterium]